MVDQSVIGRSLQSMIEANAAGRPDAIRQEDTFPTFEGGEPSRAAYEGCGKDEAVYTLV
jgi:hypothetical protein